MAPQNSSFETSAKNRVAEGVDRHAAQGPDVDLWGAGEVHGNSGFPKMWWLIMMNIWLIMDNILLIYG